jgi:hemolysin III
MRDALPAEVAGRVGGGEVTPVQPRLRGVSHEVAAFVFPALGLLLVLLVPTRSRVAVVIYTAGVTAMYATSACYHRGRWSVSARQRMRRLDHSMILIGIAATYTPIAAIGLDGSTARALLAAVWGLAAAGIVIRNAWLGAPRWLVPGVYVAVGWTALAVVPALWSQLGALTFWSTAAADPTRPGPGRLRLPRGVPRPGACRRTHLLHRRRPRRPDQVAPHQQAYHYGDDSHSGQKVAAGDDHRAQSTR